MKSLAFPVDVSNDEEVSLLLEEASTLEGVLVALVDRKNGLLHISCKDSSSLSYARAALSAWCSSTKGPHSPL